MRRILITLLLVTSLFSSYAQVPANDNCSTATNLGTLPVPAACPSGVGAAVVLNNQTNINATAPNPYTTLLNCQTGGNQPGPALDVWYRFTASGNQVNINITPGGAPFLPSPAITLWTGACGSLVGFNCDNNGTAGGNNTVLFQPTTPGQVYYIQVSGMNNVTSGNFNLSVNASNDCNNCLQTSSLTVTPAPVNGVYAPGTTVNFCLKITQYTQVSANWLHGVIPTFGCGWDLPTLSVTPPVSCSGSGTWGWYNTWTSTANASVWGPGFAFNYTFPADANPGNNFGDNCATPNWNFCWSIKTKSVCTAGCTNLNVSINTTGDGESGSWTSIACQGDPNVQVAAVMSCCTTTASVTHVTCFGGNNGTASATPTGVGPFTYTWTSVPVQNTQVATNLPAGTYTVISKDNNNCISQAVVTITQSPIINLPITSTSVTCFNGTNGSATVTPSGGNGGPYTYTWSTAPVQNTQVASNLPAGTYTVSVKDGTNCVRTNTVTIIQPTQITVTTNTTNATCSQLNGSATANPIGGNGPYTYSWNTVPVQTTQTAINIGAGSYTVIVTGVGGCTASATASITSTGSITATATSTNVSCFGGTNGTAIATPLGGGPYTYTWNSVPVQNTQTATNLPAGNYTVTVNSLGCLATATVTITQPTSVTATSSQTNVTCFGGNNGAASVNPAGGTPPYTYLWSNAQITQTATNLVAGNYTCTITDNKGCTKQVVFVITQPTQVTAAMSMTATTCGLPNGYASVSPAGGVGPYTYLWSNGSTTQSITNILSGLYTVTVTSVGGCTVTNNINVTNTGAPTVTIPATVNVSCFGGNNGSANSNVVGGVGPFTYTWNSVPVQNTPNATNLIAGNYTLIVSGSNGCSSTATVTITQPTSLTITNSFTNVSCFGGNNGSAIANPAGGTPPYTYLWTNGQTTQTAINLVAGNYTCTVTDNRGCQIATSVTITQPTLLTTASSFTNVSCFGGNNGSAIVTPAGGTAPYTYLWSNAQTTQSVTNLVAGNYTCTITDNKGCQVTQAFVITQPTQITSAISMTATTCGLPNGSASVSPVGGVGPYTYLWSNAQVTQSITGILAGNYTCTITDFNGCQLTKTITVTNTGAPTVTIPTTVNILCFGGNNGSANSNVVGGVGPYTYLWSNGQTTPNAINLIAGTYTLVVTGANTCSASAVVTITQPTQLTAAITTTNVSCFGGNNGSAIATPAGGVGPYNYIWTNAQVTQVATNLPLGVYTCTITDANGCQVTAAANITQPTLLTLVPNTQTNISCFGGNNGSLNVTAAGGTGLYQYSLNNGPNQLSATFNALTVGTYTIRVTDANGCIATTTVTLTQPTQLASISTVTNVTCFGSCNGQILLTPNGGTAPYSYAWSNGATSISASGLCSGTYSVVITDANGCQISLTNLNVTQPTALGITPNSLPSTICTGQSSNLTSNVIGGTPPYAYVWSNGGTTSNISVSPTITTTYSVNATDVNGCIISGIVTVSVNPVLSGIANSQPNSICAGNTSTLSATASGGSGGPYTFLWVPGGPGQSVVVTPASTTIYTVTISDGCSSSITMTTVVTVNPKPTIALSTTPLSGCEPFTITYTNLTPNSSTCLWTINGIPYNTCAVTHTFPVGTYVSNLTVTDANGCSSTSSNIIANVYQNPVASFVPDPYTTDILSPTITFTNLSTPGGYVWNFGDNTTTSIVSPTHVYGDTGTYLVQLIVTTQHGCIDIAYATVHIDDIFAVYVPNAFTPNGDGRNDTFYPVVTGAEKYTFWIFDRWGEMIYTSDAGTPWDSTYKGPQVQDGVYIWKLIAIDKRKVRHEFVGHVTLIK